jgi:hypothetical protein
MLTMTRRDALRILAAMGMVWTRWEMPMALAAESAPTLVELCQGLNLEAGQRLGQQYLLLYPDEADLGWLVQQILGHPAPSEDLGMHIREKVRQDFAEDRVVVLEDWHLSKTECQVYAVMWFVNPPETMK